MKLQGAHVVVMGGSTGIGFAAARLARQAGGGMLTGETDRGAVLEPDAASRAGLQERRAIYRRHYAKMPSS